MNLDVEDLLGVNHKLIMDPVHGGIPLLKHEVAIVDHPLFQRLRYICQNDILSLVFPGATHSRFLHSVGAMHVGGRMFMAMIENGLKRRAKSSIRGIPDKTLEAISYFNRLVRSACLLHDSGHCSFSHQFSRTPAINHMLNAPGRFEALWRHDNYRAYYSFIPEELEHEHYSILVAHTILHDVDLSRYQLEASDIIGLMETSEVLPSQRFLQHAQALWPLIKAEQSLEGEAPANIGLRVQQVLQGIISGELDADRADYMLRDGFHSSVTIGGFNLDHLLSNLHLGWCTQTGWSGLAISEKGLGSLEDFVYSRHQMYRQVYAHKTAQGFDWLLRAAIDEVMTQPDIAAHVDECLFNIQRFKQLTDNYFWEAFRKYAEQNIASYSHCILERIKMPHLATRINLTHDEEDTYIEFLSKEHNCPKAHIVASSITARFTKIKDDFNAMKVLCRDPQTGHGNLRKITQTSHFFSKFSDDRITHFYIDPLKHQPNQFQ
ncbi:MAG: phosphohydrolase [Oleiphilaceae bacterium]|nr:phosphohydrolase [Oleiphilaceae bacterium]